MNSQLNKSKTELSIIGAEIGGCTIMQLLGQGAMGAVYIAFQHSLKRKVAIKIYPKKNPAHPNGGLKIRDEAEIVAVLNHPNIVQVFDMGETESFIYITMQFIEGEDLDSMIARYNRHPVQSKRFIPLSKTIKIYEDILDALEFAHEEGVIHFDIKPANILIEGRGERPYLADFGIARTSYTENFSGNAVYGTPIYMSPEQIFSEKQDARSDIYSIGIAFYETIAGSLPMAVSTIEKILRAKSENYNSLFSYSPSQWRPYIDKNLEKIICKAIETDPENRFQSAAAFRNELHLYYEKMLTKT